MNVKKYLQRGLYKSIILPAFLCVCLTALLCCRFGPGYTINASATGTGGIIYPSGRVEVDENKDMTFNMYPSPGYAVFKVLVDEREVGNVNTYKFENVMGPHTITASFYNPAGWESVEVPEQVEEIVILNRKILARTSGNHLLRSTEDNINWTQLPTLTEHSLYALDVDQGNLYIGGTCGVQVSSDEGDTFVWSFHWCWDSTGDVDFLNGYGWNAVHMWGSRSGINKIEPGGDWTNTLFDSKNLVVADVLDPKNIAYTNSERTLDGGSTWLSCQYDVLFNANINGVSYAFSQEHYSRDHGETWETLPVTGLIRAFARDKNGQLYGGVHISVSAPGVYVIDLSQNQVVPIGVEKSISYLATSDDYLYAVTLEGELYRTNYSTVAYLKNLPKEEMTGM